MPLTAIRHVRKMRGGAQAHLLEADDGHWYVVKFRNNPQHRRILINELVSSSLLEYLQVSAPPSALIHVSEAFLDANPEIHLTLGAKRIPVDAGWHFGSRFPGDPALTAVYDFLPDALLKDVVNLIDFRGILVFDKWTGNADGRQCVFYRAMVRPERGAGRPGFVARMIDHGFAFNGPHWDFPDAPLQGLYPRKMVYDGVRSLDDFQPWLDMAMHFPEEAMDQAWKRVPPAWIEGEEDLFQRLLEQLFERRGRLPELIAACRRSRTNPFPNWP
ncbi:MAG TPA: HipA family kinase [Bryobacteraceae bacterium]|nr:HipA family kinase [Bryobacteraceae bacterium]